MIGTEGFLSGSNNPGWKGGVSKKINYCGCGKETSDYRNKQCIECYRNSMVYRNIKTKKVHPCCRECGKICPRLTSVYCCRKCQMNSQSGNKSHLWKGGVTKEHLILRSSKEYREWREFVFARDNYCCTHCGIKSKKGSPVVLHADHIKAFAFYPELRLDVSNGRTLCRSCHKKTDSYAKNGRAKYEKSTI